MTAKAGHNSVATHQLLSIVQRIERLNEEKKALTEDIREVYSEAKSNGFAVNVIRQIIRERTIDPNERAEREAMLDLYRHALGMLADTPLGESAIAAA